MQNVAEHREESAPRAIRGEGHASKSSADRERTVKSMRRKSETRSTRSKRLPPVNHRLERERERERESSVPVSVLLFLLLLLLFARTAFLVELTRPTVTIMRERFPGGGREEKNRRRRKEE